jgi:hypothetical protein
MRGLQQLSVRVRGHFQPRIEGERREICVARGRELGERGREPGLLIRVWLGLFMQGKLGKWVQEMDHLCERCSRWHDYGHRDAQELPVVGQSEGVIPC